MTDEEIMNELKLNFDISKAGTISIENGLVSCTGNILLGPNKITELPVKFRTVGGDFLCYHNKLTSLAGAPQSVGRSFNCNNNELTSLRDAPQSVGGGFACSGNQLTSLAGAPQSVGGHFNCSNNRLESLIGAPRYVHRSFYCSENQLTSLAGAPQYVGENFRLTYRKSLALLSLLMIKGCESIDFKYHNDFTDTHLSSILDRYLGTGTQGMLPCADEMIEAGYGSNAHYD